MNPAKPECRLTAAEQLLKSELEDLQILAADMWKGREAEAIILLVRALDNIAIARKADLDGSKNLPIDRIDGEQFALLGATSALRPFLKAIKNRIDGVPWGPVYRPAMDFAYAYLVSCGKLNYLLRLAALEHHGLSETTVQAGELKIEVRHSIPEIATQFAMNNARAREIEALPSATTPKQGWPRIRQRMRRYVESVDGWFIRYENDKEIVLAYRELARAYGRYFFESEALPDDAQIGDRTFGEWKIACDQALGRLLCHIDFATLLHYKESRIFLRNVALIFVRRDDVADVWIEAGLAAERVRTTMDALTLSIDNLDDWERSYEVPCAFYIDLGRDFVLMPSFGALANPYFALFRHLRNIYRPDWDKSVDRREEIFRRDVARIFGTPRFHVPANGFKLRRTNGSLITDLDAVILDNATGSIALLQLKWHDLFGNSLSERESRRKNLLSANKWVERVLDWIGNRSAGQIADELGLRGPRSEDPPMVYVVTRYAARFSGETKQDARAAWLSWFEIVHMLPSCTSGDLLRELPTRVLEHETTARLREPWSQKFAFRGLNAQIVVRP